jgi:hypothetical protein
MVVPFSLPAQVNDRLPGRALTIAVLQGDGAIHDLRAGTATFPIVEVRDEAMKPVAGAEVTFELPADGPGGEFAGGASTAHAKTTAAGQARAPEFIPNKRVGRFFIQVSARLGDRAGTVRIEQTNSVDPVATQKAAERRSASAGPSKWWRVLAIAAGSASTVGVVLLTRDGDSSSGSVGGVTQPSGPTVTLTPGAITVGGPR